MRLLQNDKVRAVLLAVMILLQAACLLVYPAAVRQMVNVGVRQSGLRDAVPETLREQTLEDLRLFMAPEDYKTAHDAYEIENGVCTLKDGENRAALSALFAPAERLYLRVQQRGSTAMASVRSAMENGTMTQSQVLQMAREGLENELTPAQATMAAAAFLRAEYSVLGTDPNAIRAGYLRNVTLGLLACAVIAFFAGAAEQKLRRGRDARLPARLAAWLGAAGAAVLAVWGLIALAGDWAKPGALFLVAVALAQCALTFLPAALERAGSLRAPKDRRETVWSAAPSLLGAVGAVLCVVGTVRLAGTVSAVNAGLNRILAGSGGVDSKALLHDLIPGGILLMFGLGLHIASFLWGKKRVCAVPGAVGSALEVLPGLAGFAAALIALFARRFWLGVLVTLAVVCAVGLLALVQNRKPRWVLPAVRLPGQTACALTAGLAANLAAKSAITLSGALACMLCALICTRTTTKLLTRR